MKIEFTKEEFMNTMVNAVGAITEVLLIVNAVNIFVKVVL